MCKSTRPHTCAHMQQNVSTIKQTHMHIHTSMCSRVRIVHYTMQAHARTRACRQWRVPSMLRRHAHAHSVPGDALGYISPTQGTCQPHVSRCPVTACYGTCYSCYSPAAALRLLAWAQGEASAASPPHPRPPSVDITFFSGQPRYKILI